MKTSKTIFFDKRRFEMFTGFLIMFLGFLIISCGSNQNSVKSSEDLDRLYNKINENGFQIENEWVIPLGGNMISLVSNPNYIRFENDSVDVFLPYFGERHSGGAYGGSGGIEYEGPARNLRIEKNRDNKVVVKFNGKQGSELLNFIITIFPGGAASTSVNSSERASISYRGNFGELPGNSLKKNNRKIEQENPLSMNFSLSIAAAF
jgi:hypothetical protein